MSSRRKLALATLGLLVAGTTRLPKPPEPAIELHRTSSASFLNLARRSPIFVLVIGSDLREGDPKRGRSDSLHIVAINPEQGRGTIVGIPRDSYVNVPGRGMGKINASLATGGPESTVQTVSELSGIRFDYWATVEFSRFRKLVDAVGGVTVNVPYAMDDHFSGARFQPGLTKMNGVQALAFARARKSVPGGDFGRSLNQGRLMLDSLIQFREISTSPLKLASYLAAFRSLVASNVPTGELLRLAAVTRGIDPAKVENLVLPGGGGSAGGASVVLLGPGASEIFEQIRNDAVR